jgi:hypothetical protein
MIEKITRQEYLDARDQYGNHPPSISSTFRLGEKHYTFTMAQKDGDFLTSHYKCDTHQEIFKLSHTKGAELDAYITLHNRKGILESLDD